AQRREVALAPGDGAAGPGAVVVAPHRDAPRASRSSTTDPFAAQPSGVKSPLSTAWAPSITAALARRASEEPSEMRATPAAANSARERLVKGPAASAFTGFAVAWQTARSAARSGGSGT